MPLENDHWIGAANEDWQGPIFTGLFHAGAIREASIQICGLGFFELYVNGMRVGEDCLVPAFSNYAPRRRDDWVFPIADEMRYRAYVMTYDLAPYLRKGENSLCVMLGDGWFRQEKRLVEGNFSFGAPRLTFCIELTAPDGTLTRLDSGEWLRCSPGYILETNLYYGERQDLRRLPASLAQALAPALGGAARAHETGSAHDTIDTVFDEGQAAATICPGAAGDPCPSGFCGAESIGDVNRDDANPASCRGRADRQTNELSHSGEEETPWYPVRLLPPLETTLMNQTCPADRVMRTLTPRLVLEENGRRIYDCGENITGYVAVRTHGGAGKEIVVRHSEELTQSGEALDFSSAGGEGQIQSAAYVCDGLSRICHPHFCWQAFRYFELIGPGDAHHVAVVHANVEVTAEFSCSNGTLNWLFEAYLRTQLCNMHCGVPSDCPHRERLGYTGDGQLTAPTVLMTLDAQAFLRKWMEDIADGQGDNGHIQHTAPYNGGGGGPGGWGGAIYLIPQAFYQHTGQTELLARYLPHLLHWLDYMHSRSEKGLVVREEPNGWCLGEWVVPGQRGCEVPLPEPFVNTYYYIKGIDAALAFAALTGSELPNRQTLLERREDSVRAMHEAYYDPSTGSFCRGVNGADAFALDLGLGDARLFDNLAAKYEREGILDTGICGTPLLLGALFEQGRGDLALRLMTAPHGPSFEAMRKAGATTLWEYWEGENSHSHPMFGACVRYLMEYVLGVRQEKGTAGYVSPIVKPADIPDITWARGSILTPRGRIRVEWERNELGQMLLRSNLPKRNDDTPSTHDHRPG